MSRTIAVTGGLGFIGFSLALQLVKLSYNIILIDNAESKLDGKRIKIINSIPNLKLIIEDICNENGLKRIFAHEDVDGVVHLAAVSRVIDAERNKILCEKINIEGTKILLNSLSNKKKKIWIIFGSSREVYGESHVLPLKECASKNPINFYGNSKLIGESLIRQYCDETKSSGIILRFSNVYGNKYDIFDRVIPKFITRINNNNEIIIEGGEQVIDFTYIDDTVDAIIKSIKLIESEGFVFNDFHVCPGIGWELLSLINTIENELNTTANLRVCRKRDYDVVKFIGSNKKIKSHLGIESFRSLETGIRLAIPEYLNKDIL